VQERDDKNLPSAKPEQKAAGERFFPAAFVKISALLCDA